MRMPIRFKLCARPICNEEFTGKLTIYWIKLQWGPNLELMHDRVLKHPDRVENLYFTFLFVLRAVTKVSVRDLFLMNILTHLLT